MEARRGDHRSGGQVHQILPEGMTSRPERRSGLLTTCWRRLTIAPIKFSNFIVIPHNLYYVTPAWAKGIWLVPTGRNENMLAPYEIT